MPATEMRTLGIPMPIRQHIHVFGQVQGVGFRYACCRQARALGLTGWVRNCADGSVELMAEGPEDAVAALRAWCARGPDWARVSRVTAATEPGGSPFRDFTIR